MKNSLYIVWKDNSNLDISIIDEQHRGIVSTINSLYYSIQTGRENEIIKSIMIMLEQYTFIHFQTEEALMTEADYPDIKAHIVLHEALRKKTKELSVDIIRNKDSVIVLQFLKEWWLGHINKEDRKYAPFIQKLIETKGF